MLNMMKHKNVFIGTKALNSQCIKEINSFFDDWLILDFPENSCDGRMKRQIKNIEEYISFLTALSALYPPLGIGDWW